MNIIKTFVAFNPNRDVLEDRVKKNDYKLKEIQFVLSKSALALFMLREINEIEKLIFYFKYPKFSYFCIVALVTFIF
jgi:hypothetical protein